MVEPVVNDKVVNPCAHRKNISLLIFLYRFPFMECSAWPINGFQINIKIIMCTMMVVAFGMQGLAPWAAEMASFCG